MQPIFTAARCGSCHPGGNQIPAITPAALVGVTAAECANATNKLKYVVAGSPSTSYLIDKLMGSNVCGNNSRMPLDGTALTAAQIQTVENWICQGAKNN